MAIRLRKDSKGNDARGGDDAPNAEIARSLLCHSRPSEEFIHGKQIGRCGPLEPDHFRVVSIEAFSLVYDLLLRLKEWGIT